MGSEATFEIRLLASLLILIPAIVGLGLHTLLAITLYKGWRTFRRVSFYVITVQLQGCDFCALLLDLYIAFPLTLTGRQYMGDSIPLYYGPLFFEGIAFNGLFLLSFFMSFNRFLLFILPQVHNKLFTYWGTRIMSLIVWIIVFLFIGLSNYFGCRKQFAKDDFYFWYNCSNRVPGEFHYNDFMHIASNIVPITMIVMYVIIYVKIRHATHDGEMARVKQEIKFFVQTVLISVLIVVEMLAFITVPFLGITGYGQFYLNILTNLIIISNNLVTPIVIFTFNSDVREHLRSIISFRQTTVVQAV
ncbi:hypothetical protein V3C99_007357, partial [Haemonchus contortus]